MFPRTCVVIIIIVFWHETRRMYAVCTTCNSFCIIWNHFHGVNMATMSWNVFWSAAMFIFSSDVSKTHRKKSSSYGFYRIVSDLLINKAGKSCRYTYGLVWDFSWSVRKWGVMREKSWWWFLEERFPALPCPRLPAPTRLHHLRWEGGGLPDIHHHYCYYCNLFIMMKMNRQ